MDYGKNLQKNISKYNMIYPRYQFYIERFIKGLITNIHLHEITKQDFIVV